MNRREQELLERLQDAIQNMPGLDQGAKQKALIDGPLIAAIEIFEGSAAIVEKFSPEQIAEFSRMAAEMVENAQGDPVDGVEAIH
jgi:hypothetical protein